jgi:hypothetical protein
MARDRSEGIIPRIGFCFGEKGVCSGHGRRYHSALSRSNIHTLTLTPLMCRPAMTHGTNPSLFRPCRPTIYPLHRLLLGDIPRHKLSQHVVVDANRLHLLVSVAIPVVTPAGSTDNMKEPALFFSCNLSPTENPTVTGWQRQHKTICRTAIVQEGDEFIAWKALRVRSVCISVAVGREDGAAP